MQEEHTEHINQLDRYYKETLDNASVPPPADMWNRITTAMDKQEKPKGFWSSRKWLLPLLALLFISSVTAYFTLFNEKTADTENNTPITTPASSSTNTEIPKAKTDVGNNRKTTEVNTETSSNRKNKMSVSSNTETSATEQNTSTPQNNITPTPSETIAPTSPTEPEPVATPPAKKEAPKKKQSFREKHTEALKDSVRPLFVPK